MEIKINIPQNDYVQPTEVRQEVVQGICESFLRNGVRSIFHPFGDGRYRNRSKYIVRHKGSKTYYGFHNEAFSDEECAKFNGAEMKAAFYALRNAGYHMFRVYEYGTWLGYQCSKKPYMERGEEVYDFNDFID